MDIQVNSYLRPVGTKKSISPRISKSSTDPKPQTLHVSMEYLPIYMNTMNLSHELVGQIFGRPSQERLFGTEIFIIFERSKKIRSEARNTLTLHLHSKQQAHLLGGESHVGYVGYPLVN